MAPRGEREQLECLLGQVWATARLCVRGKTATSKAVLIHIRVLCGSY